MLVVLLIVVAVVVSPYVVGPILVRRSFRHRAEALIEPMEDDAPAAAVAALDEAGEELLELGYTEVARVRLESVRDVIAYVAVHVDRDASDMAAVSALVHGRRPDVVHANMVEFCTRWERGREILTNNCAEPPPFGYPRGQVVVQHAGCEDLELLHRLHRARARSEGPAIDAEMPEVGQEVEPLVRGAAHWVEAMEGCGFICPAEADTYKFTWGGAFKATWHMLPPFKRKAVRRMQEVAALSLQVHRIDATIGEPHAVRIVPPPTNNLGLKPSHGLVAKSS